MFSKWNMTDKQRVLQHNREDTVHQKRTRSKRGFGVALIFAFLSVPLIFIVLFFISESQETEASYHDKDSGLDSILSEWESDPNEDHDPGYVSNEPEDESMQEEPGDERIGFIYLTFDDGPSLTVTPGILEVLDEEGVKATFFTLPYSGGDEIIRRIISEGHEIGNHSHSHDYERLYQGSVNNFKDDVLRAHNFIYDNFDYTITTFRFPGGSQDQPGRIRNPRIEAIHNIGYRYFDWDIDTNDWRRTSTSESIINDILENTHKRSHVIILMHDVYERTLEALPGIIQGLREQGYDFDILRNHPGNQ